MSSSIVGNSLRISSYVTNPLLRPRARRRPVFISISSNFFWFFFDCDLPDLPLRPILFPFGFTVRPSFNARAFSLLALREARLIFVIFFTFFAINVGLLYELIIYCLCFLITCLG